MGLFSPATVECEDCKHLIKRDVAQVIEKDGGGEVIYCPEHRRPYDRIRFRTVRRYKHFTVRNDPYFVKEFEVNKDGTPLLYKVTPKKK